MNKKFTKIAAFASAMVLTFSATSVAYAVEGENTTETTSSASNTETTVVSGNVYGGAEASKIKEFGDLNKDGEVNSKDAVKVLQYYAELLAGSEQTIDEFLSGKSNETTESTEAVTTTTDNTEATIVATTAVTENTTDATEAATTTDGPKVQFNGAAEVLKETESTEASTESTNANTETSTSASTETSTESTEASTDASTEATTETSAEKKYSLGDVNGDGEVNSKDAVSILSYYAAVLAGNEQKETSVATESTEVATTVATEVSTGSTEATTTAVTEATTVATESTEAATTTSAE